MWGRAGIAAVLAAIVATAVAPAAHASSGERDRARRRAACRGPRRRRPADGRTSESSRSAAPRISSTACRANAVLPLRLRSTRSAGFPGRLTGPRTNALIGQLKANSNYFQRHSPPAPKTDITDADGVVYRYFAGRCFEFHPLAEFVALNARAYARDRAGTKTARERPGPPRGPSARRPRLGVLLRFRRRGRSVALGNGPGDGGAGIRARREPRARTRTRPTGARRGRRTNRSPRG